MGRYGKCFSLVPWNADSISSTRRTYKLMHTENGKIDGDDSVLKRRSFRCSVEKPAMNFFRMRDAGGLTPALSGQPREGVRSVRQAETGPWRTG